VAEIQGVLQALGEEQVGGQEEVEKLQDLVEMDQAWVVLVLGLPFGAQGRKEWGWVEEMELERVMGLEEMELERVVGLEEVELERAVGLGREGGKGRGMG
jgi:hypothetical protein